MFRFGLVLDLNTGSALFCFGVLASLAISLWIGSRAGENDSEPTSAGKATAGGTTAAEASPFTPPAPGALAAAAASAGLESAAAVDPADAARRSRILALQQQADSDAPSPKEMANFEDSNARLRGD